MFLFIKHEPRINISYMKIAILGPNAAAHFLVKHLIKNDKVEMVYHYPASATAVPSYKYTPFYKYDNGDDVLSLFDTYEIDLVITTTLPHQLWEELHYKLKSKNIPFIKPNSNIGMLEWSKITSKKLLKKLNIPTADYKIYRKDDFFKNFHTIPRPFVVKYERDWRAGLQTIVVTDDNYEKEFATLTTTGTKRNLIALGGDFKDQTFIVEEYIEGIREYSYHAISNETGWKYLGSARDYKKLYDGDIGSNTAGMGSYSPVENVDPRIHNYAEAILKELSAQGDTYVGFLYLGIMIDKHNNPIVLEINTRPGDPEIQSILLTIEENSWLEILYAIATNQPLPEIKSSNKIGCTIRIVNKNYIIESQKVDSQPILWPEIADIEIAHNSVQTLLHSTISTSGNTLEEARDKLYNFLKNKHLGNYRHRNDIGTLK